MRNMPVAVMDGVPYYGEPAALSPALRVETLMDLERQIARLQARQVATIAAMDRATTIVDDREWVKEELRAALGDSAVAAHARLEIARELTGRLRATMRALQAGAITYRMAEYLAEHVAMLDDTTARAIEADALAGWDDELDGERRTAAEFRRRVRRAVLRHDARQAEERREQSLSERRVVFTPQDDGTTELWALLPAEGAARLAARLDAAVDKSDPRTADQQRADALCDTPGAPGPAINVVVPVTTLLGGGEPGELNGEPIPASLARVLAEDASGTWRRLLTDPTGALLDCSTTYQPPAELDCGRTRYRPPAALDRYVRLRDRTCRFPGCRRHATGCEIHHLIPWSQGGRTDADNLVCLCSRHHHLRHDGGWQVRRTRDGTITWVSPTGHTVITPPATYPVGEDPGIDDEQGNKKRDPAG